MQLYTPKPYNKFLLPTGHSLNAHTPQYSAHPAPSQGTVTNYEARGFTSIPQTDSMLYSISASTLIKPIRKPPDLYMGADDARPDAIVGTQDFFSWPSEMTEGSSPASSSFPYAASPQLSLSEPESPCPSMLGSASTNEFGAFCDRLLGVPTGRELRRCASDRGSMRRKEGHTEVSRVHPHT